MTETKEIKTPSINTLVTGTDGGRQVLLVGLKTAYQNKPQYQKSLKREYDTCHEIEHPNILKYLEEKEVEGFGNCIVMEWEPARTLADYIQENHSDEEKKNIIRQIAEGLGFLHQNGLVHGALSPSVIYITSQGDRVKILNFRLRFADHLYEPMSSMKFRAPEAKDGTVTLDARTDVFSLGTILKEMGLGDDYQNVVSGSCSFGRNDRFPNIDSFLEAFEHHRVSRRSSSPENSTTASNKKAAVLVSTIVALLVIAALVFFNRNSSSNDVAQPMSEVTDSTQNTNAEAPATAAPAANETASQDNAAPAQQLTPADNAAQQYTGELVFMNNLVPQMHIDIDKLYAKGGGAAAIRKRVQTYYRGLRKALGNLNDNQFAAYDKAFAEYIQQKNAE
ncbi:MAG: protein kinase [Prevotella sp.]|nr:protein kinase [Prevotella sp.]